MTDLISVPRRSAHHHGSHRGLLSEPVDGFPMPVNAIIVPTARNVVMLKSAIKAAAKLDATLVVLCSKWSSAWRVNEIVQRKGVKHIAIDVADVPAGVVPSFETTRVLAGTKFERKTDTSLKRNLGLLLARLMGWQRIVFLDDDIEVPEPLDLRDAAGLTDQYTGVGLTVDGMPDNSVVCHAFRDAGGAQDTFIGGGALAIGTEAMTSFFPNIYNEDWFFLLDDNGLRPTTSTGRVVQKPYDPFREERARMEELGDCLAEGLFWLLDEGRSPRDADERHWTNFLRERAGFITDVIRMVEQTDSDQRPQMLAALKAARGRCQSITPDLCVRYLDAWRADRVTWGHHLNKVHGMVTAGATKRRNSPDGVREMFRLLGIPVRATYLQLPR